MGDETLLKRIKWFIRQLLCRHEPYAKEWDDDSIVIQCRKCHKGQGYPKEHFVDEHIDMFGRPPLP